MPTFSTWKLQFSYTPTPDQSTTPWYYYNNISDIYVDVNEQTNIPIKAYTLSSPTVNILDPNRSNWCTSFGWASINGDQYFTSDKVYLNFLPGEFNSKMRINGVNPNLPWNKPSYYQIIYDRDLAGGGTNYCEDGQPGSRANFSPFFIGYNNPRNRPMTSNKPKSNAFGQSYTDVADYAIGQNISYSLVTSNQVLITVPSIPQNISAVAGNTEAIISFDPPVDNGGQTITSYNIIQKNGVNTVTYTNVSSPYTVIGLTNLITYTFDVVAINSIGSSAPATSAAIIPAEVPSLPQNISTVPGNGQVIISFDPPDFNGGATITSYIVTPSDGINTFTSTSGTSSPITVTGLTNGTRYTFDIVAVNRIGSSDPATSAGVVPVSGTGTGATGGEEGGGTATPTVSTKFNISFSYSGVNYLYVLNTSTTPYTLTCAADPSTTYISGDYTPTHVNLVFQSDMLKNALGFSGTRYFMFSSDGTFRGSGTLGSSSSPTSGFTSTPITYSATAVPSNSGNSGNSSTCFPAGTPVQTDQGLIPIEQINTLINTINNKKIVAITQTTSTESHLIEFEANAIALNVPNKTTVVSQLHAIFYNGKMTRAKDIPGGKRVPYNGCPLYNVLLENYETMSVNNMIAETLHPRNNIAILYKHIVTNDLSQTEKSNLFELLNKKLEATTNLRKQFFSNIVFMILLDTLTDRPVEVKQVSSESIRRAFLPEPIIV